MPLHVTHAPDRLDLRGGGLPVVPVLEISALEDILAPPVAWVHVAHPSEEKTQMEMESRWRWSLRDVSNGGRRRATEERAGLRSVQSLDTGYAVLETMPPQTGHVVVNYLHLSAGEAWVLKQMELVVSAVLKGETQTQAEHERKPLIDRWSVDSGKVSTSSSARKGKLFWNAP